MGFLSPREFQHLSVHIFGKLCRRRELITVKHQFRNLLATPSACNRLRVICFGGDNLLFQHGISARRLIAAGVWMSDIKGAVYRLGAP
jgi:hypothetical protein